MIHYLKILPEYFKKVKEKEKQFELRKDDRNFKVGDTVLLMEWSPAEKIYTGRVLKKKITYILRNAEQYGLKRGYCILGLKDE